jgi:DNA-binding transcriptional regulator YiaG
MTIPNPSNTRAEYKQSCLRYTRYYLQPIAEWATRTGVTGSELALLLGISHKTLRGWFRGAAVPVSKASWRKIDLFSRRHDLEPEGDVWEALRG